MPGCLLREFFVLILALVLASCAPVPKKDASDSGTATARDEVLYQRALQRHQEGDLQGAVAPLVALIRGYPQSPHRVPAVLRLGQVQLDLGQPERALQLAEELLGAGPEADRRAQALMLRARALVAAGNSADSDWQEKARADLELVRQDFPASAQAREARTLLEKLAASEIRQELEAARRYLRQGRPAAAINRARYLIETFPESPQVAGALEVMARAYRNLGLEERALSTEAVLRAQQRVPNVDSAAVESDGTRQ